MNWEAVFFDFDGVIADSADIKTDAFARMFSGYGPGIEKQVVEYHLAHEGVSRFEKFNYFYKNILKKNITKEEQKTMGETFSNLVLERVLEVPFMDGAIETLKTLKELDIPAYVVSGTPHDEIKYIVRKRNLSGLFCEVHGSPGLKHEIINDILRKNGYQKSKCLFIGDAMSDHNAARKTGIRFLGIVKKDAKSPFPGGIKFSSIVTTKFQGDTYRVL